MDLALNNLQNLICHKTQTNIKSINLKIYNFLLASIQKDNDEDDEDDGDSSEASS